MTKFNFAAIDAMDEGFNLLIKEHDDISGFDNLPDKIKRAILVARAPEPLRTHLQLNSQSYTTFRKGFKLTERDDPMDVDFVHKEGQKGKSKRKGKQYEKGKSSGKGKSNQEKFQGTCKNCGKTGHQWSECWAKGGGAAKQANNVGETEKTGDVNWIMMVQDLGVALSHFTGGGDGWERGERGREREERRRERGEGCGGGGGGDGGWWCGGSDAMLMTCLWRYATTVKHLIMGPCPCGHDPLAVCLCTRP